MNLRNFISESLYQIVEGVSEAQLRIAAFYNGDDSSGNASSIMVEKDKEERDVFFDVAVTVLEETSDTASHQLLVVGLTHLASCSNDNMVLPHSRVKFSVPLCYIQEAKEKSPHLHFND